MSRTTSLAAKLGYRPACRVYVSNAPCDYFRWLEPLPEGVTFTSRPGRSTDMAHVFASDRTSLALGLERLRRVMNAEAPIWVSWPKRSSGIASTVTEDTIRELALPLGFVDVKVCAVSEVWSGLKLTVRKRLR